MPDFHDTPTKFLRSSESGRPSPLQDFLPNFVSATQQREGSVEDLDKTQEFIFIHTGKTPQTENRKDK